MRPLEEGSDFQPNEFREPVEPRPCRRHDWVRNHDWNGGPSETYITQCVRPGCGKIKDEVASRRGKSSRRLGSDGERRSEKRYGFVKVGEFGGITDLQGKTTKVQQKTSRTAPPIRWKGIFARLEEVADGRMPAILLSFVKPGVPSDDYFIVRGKDWLDWRGRDE